MSSYLHDLSTQAVLGASVEPSAVTASGNGAAVDLKEGAGTCFAVQSVGAVAGTNPTLDTKIQEAIEDPASLGNPLASDWSDVVGVAAATAPFAQVTAAHNLQTIVFQRTKRFARAAQTVGGTGSPSFTCAVLIGEQKQFFS